MQIEGPLTVGIVDNQETRSRELHIGFKADFRAQELEQRIESINAYLTELQAASRSTDADDTSTQGVLLLAQVVEQLLPHLQADEIPLNETIVIEIQSQNSLNDLIQDSMM